MWNYLPNFKSSLNLARQLQITKISSLEIKCENTEVKIKPIEKFLPALFWSSIPPSRPRSTSQLALPSHPPRHPSAWRCHPTATTDPGWKSFPSATLIYSEHREAFLAPPWRLQTPPFCRSLPQGSPIGSRLLKTLAALYGHAHLFQEGLSRCHVAPLGTYKRRNGGGHLGRFVTLPTDRRILVVRKSGCTAVVPRWRLPHKSANGAAILCQRVFV